VQDNIERAPLRVAANRRVRFNAPAFRLVVSQMGALKRTLLMVELKLLGVNDYPNQVFVSLFEFCFVFAGFL